MVDKENEEIKKPLNKKYLISSKKDKEAKWAKLKDSYPWSPFIDYRLHPEEYKVGKGEQGVLICQPYRNEILPHWRFKTPSRPIDTEAAKTNCFSVY